MLVPYHRHQTNDHRNHPLTGYEFENTGQYRDHANSHRDLALTHFIFEDTRQDLLPNRHRHDNRNSLTTTICSLS